MRVVEPRTSQLATTSKRFQVVLSRYRAGVQKIDDGPDHWALIRDGAVPSDTDMRGIVGIPTRGCSYARTDWGGCSVCGHNASTLWKHDINALTILRDVRKSLSALDRTRPRHLCLYTSGSFFDDSELPQQVRREILLEVASRPWVRSIALESLAQFITTTRLVQMRELLPSQSVSIGMGLDSSDAFVRALCFQRHVPNVKYADALRVCAEANVQTTAYIVHKPPFLTNEEAVFDTLSSITCAFKMGFSNVSIEPVAMQQGTVQGLLYSMGSYSPPTIWTVGSSLVDFGEGGALAPFSKSIVLGGQVFTPLPTSGLKACVQCIAAVRGKLANLPIDFFDSLPRVSQQECGCEKRDFIRPQPIDPEAVMQRANSVLSQIEGFIDSTHNSLVL